VDTEKRGKILSSLPGIEPRLPGRPVRSQDTMLTELPGSHEMEKSVLLILITAFAVLHKKTTANATETNVIGYILLIVRVM
jgi:hypothetical protein